MMDKCYLNTVHQFFSYSTPLNLRVKRYENNVYHMRYNINNLISA